MEKLSKMLDKYAPLTTKALVVRSLAGWYTESILQLKRIERKAERTWRRTGLHVNQQNLQGEQK